MCPVTYVEPSWPNKVYSEHQRGIVKNELLNVTINVWYEDMRIHLPFLPYEAAFEEVVRRCELALGGMRLPPTVWFSCRTCCRRLSLANDPQRRMPGSCRPDRPWDWTMHIPFRVFMTMGPDPMKDSVAFRMPSRHELIRDVCSVALKAFDQPHTCCRILMDGKPLPYDKSVEACGIKEDDRLVLELIPPLKVTLEDEFSGYETVCNIDMCVHSSLRTLVKLMTDKLDSVIYVQRGMRVVWNEGDSFDVSLWDLGVRFECSVQIRIGPPEVDTTSSLEIQTDDVPEEKRSFSCQAGE